MLRRKNSNAGIEKSELRRLAIALLSWFSRNARDLPWRRTRDPYPIWVSEIMLQQTQVKTVLRYWESWMRELPTIEALAKASPAKIHKRWEGLGYYTRVRNLQKAARVILRRHNGQFPEKFEDILALPGIGRYTAGAICSIAFNQAAPILDGNVIRVLTRFFGIAGNPREQRTNALLWRLAEELVTVAAGTAFRQICSAPRASHFNQSLMELGALVCTPRQPKCVVCPVARNCVAFRQERIGEFPNTGRRAAPTARRFAALVLRRRGRFLVRQRPAGVVNAHLWEFPNFEIREETNAGLRMAARSILGFAPGPLVPLGVIKHSITRYRIALEAFLIEAGPGLCNGALAGRWLPLHRLREFSFPSAHRKILTRLEELSL